VELFPTVEPQRDMILASTRLVTFNVVDQIAYKFHLFVCVLKFSIYEFFLDQDRQFNNVEQVESEVVPEVRVNADRVDFDSQMLSDESTDLNCKNPPFRRRGSPTQCQDAHASAPNSTPLRNPFQQIARQCDLI
jgi:hypothetical protein